MPTIYDNINEKLLDGLKAALKGSKRGDFCVGYLNLRGWDCISAEIDKISSETDNPACRLIVGRLLVVSPFPDSVQRITAGTARKRNVFMLSVAERIVIGYMSWDGALAEALSRVAPHKDITQLSKE